MRTIRIRSLAHTQSLARSISRSLRGGVGIGLEGPLGAGKTQFAKGLAAALGIKKHLSSPTFVIHRPYRTGSKVIRAFHHFDLYRLPYPVDPEAIGLADALTEPRALVTVEWPERLPEKIRRKLLRIKIAYGKKPNQRTITLPDALV